MWQVDIYHFEKTDFIKLYKATTKRSMNKLFWFKKIFPFKNSSLHANRRIGHYQGCDQGYRFGQFWVDNTVLVQSLGQN